jgi:hypothetical protein
MLRHETSTKLQLDIGTVAFCILNGQTAFLSALVLVEKPWGSSPHADGDRQPGHGPPPSNFFRVLG